MVALPSAPSPAAFSAHGAHVFCTADRYIIIITKAQLVGRIRGHSVYKIQATEFLPLRERQLHDPDEDTYLSLLRTHLRTGPMYFSYTFDLTSSLQRQSSANLSLPLWQRADDRFFWNRYVQSDLIDLRASNPAVDPYILPAFFGFLNISTSAIKSTPCTFILLSRRSRHRAGTRYFTRGLDSMGNAANFNETEQIVILGDSAGGLGGQGYDQHSISGSSSRSKLDSEGVQVFSYVQTRGSVPVYWAEVNDLKLIPTLHIRSVDVALDAARKHFDEQIRLYGDNYLVNLVNQKGREERIKTAYEQTIKSLVSSPTKHTEASEKTSERFHVVEPQCYNRQTDRLHYVYFDFHHECRSMRWYRAQLLLDKLADGLETQRYFHSTGAGATSTIRSWQSSVVRTNCMDCLDRTNVVQSMLARHALDRQMRDASVLGPAETTAASTSFETMFRNAWADNADVVSRAYSGTGALKTDFTRTGVRTKTGALVDASNSLTRYFRNNFADGPRQDAFDLFLGTYLPRAPSTVVASRLFVDRRPLVVQAVPYILAAAVFLELLAFLTPRAPSALFAMRIFTFFWLLVGLWAATFLLRYGSLYVSWPRLNPPQFAVDAHNRCISTAAKHDLVVGRWIGQQQHGHERGGSRKGSIFRIERLEEGKKRIE